jgi:hypothetical protein
MHATIAINRLIGTIVFACATIIVNDSASVTVTIDIVIIIVVNTAVTTIANIISSHRVHQLCTNTSEEITT